MTVSPPRGRRGRPRAAAVDAPRDLDTESRILDAARRVFVRRGTAGARMLEIAAEAGVNQALLHYYFGTKEQLSERVFVESAGRLAAALISVPPADATLDQLVERFVVGYIDAVRTMPLIPPYLLAEAHQHPERIDALMVRAAGTVPAAIVAATAARVEQMIAERVAEGTMRPVSVRQFMVNVMALVSFPFLARPVLLGAFGFDDASFDEFLQQRRQELPRFIMNAMRP